MLKNSIFLLAFFIFSLSQTDLDARPRPSGYPYICGDTFRAFCDFIYDETGSNVIPEAVGYGDAIFVKTDMLDSFFEAIHPVIASPYVLVTHNGDLHVPREFEKWLDDPKILMWYGQNAVTANHPKLRLIPIGIGNSYCNHGKTEVISQAQEMAKEVADRSILLYMNFSVGSHAERYDVYKLFRDKAFCLMSGPKPFKIYLSDLRNTKFVLCPRGNGMDCHRTWEALLMGAIPVVRSSPLDPLFKELPVLIVDEWEVLTEKFLEEKWQEMSRTTYCLDRMYAPYWLNMLSSHRNLSSSLQTNFVEQPF